MEERLGHQAWREGPQPAGHAGMGQRPGSRWRGSEQVREGRYVREGEGWPEGEGCGGHVAV